MLFGECEQRSLGIYPFLNGSSRQLQRHKLVGIGYRHKRPEIVGVPGCVEPRLESQNTVQMDTADASASYEELLSANGHEANLRAEELLTQTREAAMAFRSILDPKFQYTNASSTDITQTFKRIRGALRQQSSQRAGSLSSKVVGTIGKAPGGIQTKP